MGQIFSIGHNIEISPQLINKIERLLKENLKSIQWSLWRMQYLLENSVKLLQPFVIILSTSISSYFFTKAIYYLVSAWKKLREGKKTTANIALIRSPDSQATPHIVGQILQHQSQTEATTTNVYLIMPPEIQAALPLLNQVVHQQIGN